MPDPWDIFAFIYAVVWKNWIPLILTGAPSVLLETYKWKSGKELPFASHLRWLFVIGAVIAVFFAWHDEYEAKLRLEKNEVAFDSSSVAMKQKDAEIAQLREELHKADNHSRDLQMEINELKRDKIELAQQHENDKKVSSERVAGLQKDLKERDARLDEKASWRIFCDSLANFMDSGRLLKIQSENENQPPANSEVYAWGTKVEEFLKAHLGKVSVEKFRSPEGLQLPMASSIQSDAHRKLWFGLTIRLARLNEYSASYCK